MRKVRLDAKILHYNNTLIISDATDVELGLEIQPPNNDFLLPTFYCPPTGSFPLSHGSFPFPQRTFGVVSTVIYGYDGNTTSMSEALEALETGEHVH